jgi:hypothetical protein
MPLRSMSRAETLPPDACRARRWTVLRRNRTLVVIGIASCLAAWLAWKVLLTANSLPTPAPVRQGSER